MRVLALPALPFLFAACGTTVAEPRVTVAPYLAVYQLRGNAGLQSNASGAPTDTQRQDLHAFGQGQFDEDLGARVDIGDGFGGIRFEYFRLHDSTSDKGTLTDDWGSLRAGDQAHMNASMDEFRIGYVQPVWTGHANVRDQQVDLRFGAGGYFAHRDLQLHTASETGTTQNLEVRDHGLLYPAVRGRAAWHELSFDLDYAFCPGFSLGGDFHGWQQDVDVRLAYTLARHDITFFGGWRYSTWSANGHEGGLAFDTDLILDGFQFGVQFTF